MRELPVGSDREALHRVRETLASVTPPTLLARGVRSHVRDVVIIASSSRGGSSMLAELLRCTPQLLHLRAEANPFLVLSELAHPHSGTGSDALGASFAATPAADVLDRLLACDVGAPSDDEAALSAFPATVAARLSMQWPLIAFDVSRVEDAAGALLREVDPRVEPARFHVRLLERLAPLYPGLSAAYYDVPNDLIVPRASEATAPQGPPSPLIVEEPPFVTIRPWRLADDAALGNRPLIVKTPSNVYRLAFLRAFFPNARVRVLHLCRNVAASVNGLVDGWGYGGFFSHRLDSGLHIEGYSDSQGDWARHWWKYDLPPGWQAYAGRPLVEVCAFQWWSAHDATLRFLGENPEVASLRLHFEDLAGSRDQRALALGRLCDWLGIEIDRPLSHVIDHGLPPVMATAPPRQRRWFERADQLDHVIRWPHVRRMMEMLGYDDAPETWT